MPPTACARKRTRQAGAKDDATGLGKALGVAGLDQIHVRTTAAQGRTTATTALLEKLSSFTVPY